MPGAVIKVPGITGPEVVAFDHATVQPELPQQFNVPGGVEQIATFGGVNLSRDCATAACLKSQSSNCFNPTLIS
jgi:hypothetical protein